MVDRDFDEHLKMNQSFRKGNEIHQLRLGIDILLIDINLEQVVADDNIRLRDRENDDEDDESEEETAVRERQQMLSAEHSRRYRERKRANANVNVNLDQSNILNHGRLRLRRTSENESVVQERQGNPLAEIRNRSIVNVDINLEQVVADDNIRLRD